MTRWASRILSLVSFLLLLYALSFWLRSTFQIDWLRYFHPGGVYEVYGECGTLHVGHTPSGHDPAANGWFYRRISGQCEVPWPAHSTWRHATGTFRWRAGPAWNVGVPFWAIALAAALLPACWFRRHGRRRTALRGLVVAFGLWPFVLVALFAPAAADGWSAALALWLGAFMPALFGLGARDLLTHVVNRRPKPWPWQVRARRRYLRRLAGQCLACGYDLRGSEGRCPECGTIDVPEAESDASR